ncbi:MAG: hypothetical protein KGL39_22035 [Patescibacteria group bacterium]|nr:hypothetical protein [Patescibacteria group bacterium]
MSFLQWFGTMPIIDEATQIGRGVAAAIQGQPYEVYRRTSASNGSVISGTPLYTNYPVYFTGKAKKVEVENTAFDLLVFEGHVDATYLQKMDVFVETGYRNDGGIWIFAQSRPVEPSLFVRAETLAFISRPYTEAGSVAQQPSSGVQVNTGYGGTRIGIEKYLLLENGIYTFSADATTGASIPIGIQPLNRVRDGSIPKVPTKQYRTHHLIYIPMVKGEMLDVQDRINAANGDRYEIMESHSTAPTGLDGYITICEKLPT